MHIRVVTPIVTRDFRAPGDLEGLVHPGLELSHVFVDMGPASIESAFDETLAAPGALFKIIEAEAEGADAVAIDCLGDPGMHAGREAVRIPVVGAGEASMHLAAMLGHRFSILTTLDRVFHLNENQARIYGLQDKLVSLRAVNAPVLDLEKDPSGITEGLIEQGIAAVREDGAHVLLLGCTGMANVARAVQAGLRERGFDVPLVEPLAAAVRMAELWISLGLRHSKVTYDYPPAKSIIGYPTRTERRP